MGAKKTVYMKSPSIWKEAERKAKKQDPYMSLSRLLEALIRLYLKGSLAV